MDEHEYIYKLRPLVIPGLFFLVLYPILLGCIYLFHRFPSIELGVLIGIYCLSVLGILSLWVIGKSKRVLINEQQIIFSSLLGKHVLDPKDIRRVAFYFDGKGQEVAQIRTGDVFFYVSEFYFPFPELMSDLENFIRQHGLRSNLENYLGLNE
ncbi:hypothetical protein [Desulfosporosinus sp. FKA]|uniref:hypothetical protein n=1 Tax=Desulfosporosinus sp. FKA TaxID=1969834 RepID=UPI000B49FE27|nr:hypothetical protein [Desulfosporosinus sp. FKA]